MNETDLDHQGAIIWVWCPTCGASSKVDCTSIPILGILEPGKVHLERLQKWIELKKKVVAGSILDRWINIQQIPRSEPHIISEGGSEEAAKYWENRNNLRDKK